MKKIMFATDLSDNSQQVFPYAIQLAKDYNAWINLVFIYETAVYKLPHTEYTEAQEKLELASANNRLERMYEEHVGEDNAKTRVSFKIVKDLDTVQGILNTIKKDKPDLLMLSTFGDNVGKELFSGKLIRSLVSQCPIPVMAIPMQAKYSPPSKLLYATNFYDNDIMALKNLIALLAPFEPRIDIVHISRDWDAEKEADSKHFWDRVQEEVRYGRLQWRVVLGDNVYLGLNKYIFDHEPDFVVLTDKDNGLWYDMFHIDLINRVEFNSYIPVLTFNEIGLSQLTENDWSMAQGERS